MTTETINGQDIEVLTKEEFIKKVFGDVEPLNDPKPTVTKYVLASGKVYRLVWGWRWLAAENTTPFKRRRDAEAAIAEMTTTEEIQIEQA